MARYKIGITEAGDAGLDLSWADKLDTVDGVIGVFYDKEREKWVASITYDHKRKLLGRFASKDDAIRARLDKEAELFKEFAPQSNQRIEA